MPAAIDTGMSNANFPCRRLQSCTDDKHTSDVFHCLKNNDTFKITQKEDIQINFKKIKKLED